MSFLKRCTVFLLVLLLSVVGLLQLPSLPVAALGTNLIANPSAETVTSSNGLPDSWSQGKWGTSTATFSDSPSAHTGSHSLKIAMTAYASGDAKWYFSPVTVAAGSAYTFSDYYQSTTATSLVAQITATNGTTSYIDLGAVAANSAWTQATATFTAPAGSQNVTVFHLINSVGSLTIDDASLAQAATPSPTPTPTPSPTPAPTGTNVIPNPSVETVSPTNANAPTNWQTGGWGTNTTAYTYQSTGAQSGTRSLQVKTTAYTNGDAKWFFTPQAVTPGGQYTFSDYYKSTVATDVAVQFDDGNGHYTYQSLGSASASSTAWKQFTYVFTVPTTIKNATIFHSLAGIGTLQTDNFSLVGQGIPPSDTVSGNLIANPSMETVDPNNSSKPSKWQSSKWGTNTTSFSYLVNGIFSGLIGSVAHTGNRAVQVKTSNYTDGDAKWYSNQVAVTPNTQYRYSDYYKATIASEVDVAFTMSDGSTTYQIIGLPDIASSWTKFDTTFTVPIGAVSMTVFHLIRGNGTLTLDDASLQTYTPVGLNRAMVSLTFDDGYASQYNYTLPLLKQYGFASTQYIVSGLIDVPGYLSLDQLKALAAAGQEIGSHTITHPDLTTMTKAQYTNELTASQTQLKQWTGQSVSTFAYPEGRYNQGTTSVAKPLYTATRGVESGLNSKDNFNAYDIKVQDIRASTTTAQIANWIAQAQATHTWLVFVYHSVNPNTTDPFDMGEYTITPTQLDSHFAAIKSSGIAVLTMQQALAEIKPQL